MVHKCLIHRDYWFFFDKELGTQIHNNTENYVKHLHQNTLEAIHNFKELLEFKK